MDSQTLEQFFVIGISVRTTNENGQSGRDIPALWAEFLNGGILEKIPNKIDDSLYCIYTDYEKDYTKPYTTLLGCRVTSLQTIPDALEGRCFDGGTYTKIVARGNILEGMVFNEWVKIWNLDLKRRYTVDFEVYGEKAENPEHAEVDIFIATE